MTRWVVLLGIGVVAACSSLPDAGSGVVALEVTIPDSTFLSIGASVTLHARALDLQGDPVAGAVVVWHTPDTALATLDTASGTVTARVAAGIVHVQARTSSLLSNVISLTLRDSTHATSLRQRP